MALVAKFKCKLGLFDWSQKSQTSIPLVLVMKITPGLVGEKAPLVLCDPKVFADLKIGCSKSLVVFQTAK